MKKNNKKTIFLIIVYIIISIIGFTIFKSDGFFIVGLLPFAWQSGKVLYYRIIKGKEIILIFQLGIGKLEKHWVYQLIATIANIFVFVFSIWVMLMTLTHSTFLN